jgi:hypothetical protein
VIRTAALLSELSQLGVTLSKRGHEIVLEGPDAVLTDALVGKLRAIKSQILRNLDAWDFADWQAFYDERAGITEFDGQALRLEAERHAHESCIVEWLNRHPAASVPGQCALCGQLDRSDHVVVPFGTDQHTWLHPECWPAWHEERQVQAIAALRAMGIAARRLPNG